MCAQLAVDCGAPHAQKDTHLAEERSVAVRIAVAVFTEKPTFQLAHPERLQVSEVLNGGRVRERTWGRGLAVGAAVISRNRADQLSQSFLIAQLLALANAIRHGEGVKGVDTIRELRVVEEDRGKVDGPGGAEQIKENDGGPRFCEGFAPRKSGSFLVEGYAAFQDSATLKALMITIAVLNSS